MNVEIWHFPLCGLSVNMVYKDAQCAPFVGGMHTHYRRGDHWSPAAVCRMSNFPGKALPRQVDGRTVFAPTCSIITGK